MSVEEYTGNSSNVIKINVNENEQILSQVVQITSNDLERSEIEKKRSKTLLEDVDNLIRFRDEMMENAAIQTSWMRINVLINAVFLGCLAIILIKLI